MGRVTLDVVRWKVLLPPAMVGLELPAALVYRISIENAVGGYFWF